ncbi:F24B9.27 [Arabidopsis thaliana]|uniref:F24B9.27 n=1 Tax=Arabidopsis thaliana TaxID=3702 RepID=Q9LQP0_ARATH|nr:F24B9.27 [Arabidopsis thaliana]
MIYLHRIYFIIVLFTLIFHGRLGFSDNNKLHEAEVRALKEIGKKLGKKDWDFNKDPCSGEGTWIVTTYTTKGFESNITCDCSFLPQNSSCHVIRIVVASLMMVTMKGKTTKFLGWSLTR